MLRIPAAFVLVPLGFGCCGEGFRRFNQTSLVNFFPGFGRWFFLGKKTCAIETTQHTTCQKAWETCSKYSGCLF